MTVKEKALAKMLDEMKKEHSPQEDAVHNWLCDQEDESLFAGIMENGKSIAGALKDCKSKAQKQAVNGMAMIKDDTVWGWIYFYFTGKKMSKAIAAHRKQVSRRKSADESEGVEQINLFDMP